MPEQNYSIEEIGRRVRARQPDAFANFTDAEIGQRMIERHPELSNVASSPEMTSPNSQIPSEGDGILKTIVKGVAKPFAEFGTSVYNVGSSIGKLAKGDVQGADQALSAHRNIPYLGDTKPLATGKESTLEAAKKMGAYGTQIASTIIPVGKVAGAGKPIATGLSGLAQRIGTSRATQFGLANVLGETGREVSEGEDLSLKKIAASGALGTVIPGIGSKVKQGLSKLPEKTWAALLKQTPQQVAKNPNLAREISEIGITGATKKGLSQSFGNKIQQIEVELDDVLTKKQGSIDGKTVAAYLDELKNTYKNIPGEENAVDVISNIQNDVIKKGKLGLLQANQLKRDIYGLISKSYGKGNLEVPAKTEAQKKVAFAIKEQLEKAIPEIKKINQKQAVFIQAKKAIDSRIAREVGKGIAGTGVGMYDILLGGAGTLAGGPTAGIGVALGKKAIESPITLTNVSSAAQKLVKYFDSVSPTKKLLIQNALRVLGREGAAKL